MLQLMVRLTLWLSVCTAALLGGIIVGRAQPGGAEMALTSSEGRSNRARTYLIDLRASLTYPLPLRLGANTFLAWVGDRRFLLRQSSNLPHYLLFEIGQGAQRLYLPDDCREGSLRGRGEWLSCTGRQGGGLLTFSTTCALGECADQPRRWVPGALITEHVWSPDGEQIAFADIALNSYGLLALDLRDGQVTRISEDLGGIAPQISWSPDGEQIAYYTADRMTLRLHVVDVVTQQDTFMLPLRGVAPDEPPSWSPDGAQLAMFEYDEFGADIFTVDLTRQAVEWLTNGKGASAYPRWSPDGERIAYYVNANGQVRLYVTSTIDSSTHIMTEMRVNDLGYAWRPCGEVGC
jgi:hypothetical protein